MNYFNSSTDYSTNSAERFVDYFELFNIKKSYKIDKSLLQREYFRMQKENHPDFAKTQKCVDEMNKKSDLINNGYKILSDDYLRAIHLLQINGVDVSDQKTKHILSQAELADILEQFELFHDLQKDDSISIKEKKIKMEDFCSDLVKKRNNIYGELDVLFYNKNFEKVLYLVIKLKYFNNLINEVNFKSDYDTDS